MDQEDCFIDLRKVVHPKKYCTFAIFGQIGPSRYTANILIINTTIFYCVSFIIVIWSECFISMVSGTFCFFLRHPMQNGNKKRQGLWPGFHSVRAPKINETILRKSTTKSLKSVPKLNSKFDCNVALLFVDFRWFWLILVEWRAVLDEFTKLKLILDKGRSMYYVIAGGGSGGYKLATGLWERSLITTPDIAIGSAIAWGLLSPCVSCVSPT